MRIHISDRHRSIINHVYQFKQLTSPQIRELDFDSLHSPTPCYRALTLLVEHEYLAIIEPPHGGPHGGMGPRAYRLGRAGHRLMRDDEYRPVNTVDPHTLAIGDTHICVVRLERAGVLKITALLTEPDCHQQIGDQDVRPDMFDELTFPKGKIRINFEVDMARYRRKSESAAQIKEKLVRYWRAYQEADMEFFPLVVFVCFDEWRQRELTYLIRQGKPEQQELFRSFMLEDLSTWLRQLAVSRPIGELALLYTDR